MSDFNGIACDKCRDVWFHGDCNMKNWHFHKSDIAVISQNTVTYEETTKPPCQLKSLERVEDLQTTYSCYNFFFNL